MPEIRLNQSPSAISIKRPGFYDAFRFASGYWKQQPRKLIFILIFLGISALLEANMPNMLSGFLKTIREHQEERLVLLSMMLFIGNYFAQVIFSAIAATIYNLFETHVFKSLLDDGFTHIHRLSEQYFVNNFTGAIISKITRARNRIESFEDQIILKILPTIVMIVGSTFFLALRFPLLAALMIIYLIIMLSLSALLVSRFSGPAQAAYAKAQDAYTAHMADGITGILTTKSFAHEVYELTRFFAVTESLREKNVRAYIFGNYIGVFQKLLLGGMLTLLMGGGVWYSFQGQATVENVAYLAFAYTLMQSYIQSLADNVKNILTASYDLHAIINLLREEPSVADIRDAAPLVVTAGKIDFEKVSFTYPQKDQPIFHDLTLSIRAGERLALVGHSGSGKTTFVRLLQRLYDIQGGTILIDGQSIAQTTQKSLRSSISLVPQDPILFHRSLKDNIAYGKPEVSLEEVRVAARQAHIDTFIMGLPYQYETLVGERGVKLSGGERQRIAIARAIIANRPILILDEATSSLDSASECVIQDALRTLTHGRTSIMIAHRLSTILDADRILVFDKGQIVEEGTHAELCLKKHGIYANFFALQASGFIVE